MSKLFFWTPFNARRSRREKFARFVRAGKPHPVETEKWTKRRIELWSTYTLPSILNQAHDDFIYAVFLSPALKHLTDGLLPDISDERVVYSYDDSVVADAISQHGGILAARIDSDDMYGRDAGMVMMACPDEWMYFRIGYAYDTIRNRLFKYDTVGTGPFHARRLGPDFLMQENRRAISKNHSQVINHRPTALQGGNFCVTLHEQNTSSTIRASRVGRPVRGLDILHDVFGYAPRKEMTR